MTDWQNRIVRHGTADPNELVAHPQNWRLHPAPQRRALAGVLNEVGWVQRVVVNERTGRILDGHLRVNLARENGATSIPVVYVDLSEDEERVILASLDPITAMAEADTEHLKRLVASVPEAQDEAVRELLAGLVPEPAFTPTTQPRIELPNYDQEDIERAEQRLATQYDGSKDGQQREIICPECHRPFYV